MKPLNEVGTWCVKDGCLCEYNLEDSPTVRKFACSGAGGKCKRGSAFCYEPLMAKTEKGGEK